MKKVWDDYRGLFLFVIVVRAVAVIAAGVYGYRYWKDMSHLNRLKENVPAKVQTMLQALEKQDLEAILACVHPVAGKTGDETQRSIVELLQFLNGRSVAQLQLSEPKLWERGEGEYLAKSSGTVILSDGSRYPVSYTYLLDGSEGFIHFQIDNKGISV